MTVIVFTKAILFCLNNHQSSHSHLRQIIARHLSNNYAVIFDLGNNSLYDDQKSIKKCIRDLESDGNWSGKGDHLATGDFSCRDVCVYKYSTSALATPAVYSSKSNLPMFPPLSICFYELQGGY